MPYNAAFGGRSPALRSGAPDFSRSSGLTSLRALAAPPDVDDVDDVLVEIAEPLGVPTVDTSVSGPISARRQRPLISQLDVVITGLRLAVVEIRVAAIEPVGVIPVRSGAENDVARIVEHAELSGRAARILRFYFCGHGRRRWRGRSHRARCGQRRSGHDLADW